MNTTLRNKYILVLVVYLLMLLSAAFCTYVPVTNLRNTYIIILVLSLIGYLSIYYILISERVNLEYLLIIFFVTLFWDLALISKTTEKHYLGIIILGSIIINFSLFSMLIKICCQERKNFNIAFFLRGLKYRLYKNKYIILILTVFVIFSLSNLTVWLQADGYDYYSGVRWSTTWDFANMDKLTLSGHNSHGYVLFILIGEFIYPNAIIATRIMNIVLAVITIISLDKIIKVLFSNFTEVMQALCTSIFAFSPILFSMTAEINTDFAVLCFMIWLISAYLKDKHILVGVCGLLVCFSKETGLLVYGFFMIGVFLKNLLIYFQHRKNFQLTKIVTKVISIPLLIECFGGCAWLCYFLSNDRGIGWTDVYAPENLIIDNANKINTFAFDLQYILFKLEQIFIMNSIWIFVGIILAGGIFSIFAKFKYNKERHSTRTVNIPLFFIAISTFIYNLSYITWTNYRYLITAVFFVILVAVSFVSKLRGVYKSIVLIFMLLVSILSNYITDPIAQRVFIDFNTNKYSKMIITPRFSVTDGYVYMKDKSSIKNLGWCDTMVYNRQYTYWGRVIDKFLDEIDYDENKAVIMPLILSSKESMYSRFLGRSEKCIDKTVWNKKTRHVEYITFQGDRVSENVKLDIKFADTKSTISIKDYKGYSEVYFVQLPLENTDYMLKDIPVLDNKTYHYLSCEINVTKLK